MGWYLLITNLVTSSFFPLNPMTFGVLKYDLILSLSSMRVSSLHLPLIMDHFLKLIRGFSQSISSILSRWNLTILTYNFNVIFLSHLFLVLDSTILDLCASNHEISPLIFGAIVYSWVNGFLVLCAVSRSVGQLGLCIYQLGLTMA
jgi:uncharacterized membrane protein YvlD (DUF360 family)